MDKIKLAQRTIALLSSMIESGECHTTRTKEMKTNALSGLDEVNNLLISGVSKRFDFDKLLQEYRQEFVNGGGYVKSDTFESGTEPYEVFEWFKKKLS